VAPTITRVLAISVDGLNPAAITKLGRSGAPNFYRLRDEGATTLNARTEREQTVTLPNHTGMLTGRRIDRTQGGHGVTWDDDRPRTTVQGAAGHATKSVFSVVHQSGGSTALFSTKTKFGLYQRSWPGSIDRFVVRYSHAKLLPLVREDLVDHARAFTFLHVSLPDRTGHASGFMSKAYVDAVKRTDYQIGTILKTIDDHAALRNHLVMVLTADHGGLGAGHSSATSVADYRVPFLVWGPGVAHGNLYDLNPDYRDPGTARTTYAGIQPVRNGDVANLSADLLGLAAVPGSTLDAKRDLDVR
jgi:predicted AlkP superfamily pyrophosphatase or phosphodiesterase